MWWALQLLDLTLGMLHSILKFEHVVWEMYHILLINAVLYIKI